MNDEEQEKERLNRKLIELLNELRIAIPGVQVLFAFLLILPFNSGFVETDDLDRAVYAGSLSCAAVASALLIGPAAYHRHRFRRLEEETASDKKEMIITQDHLAAGGILFLALCHGRLGLHGVRRLVWDGHRDDRRRKSRLHLRVVLVRAPGVATDP